jgi:hypothetical protein
VTRALVEALLGFLERLEARALSWGFYDVSFDEVSLASTLDEEAPQDLRTSWAAASERGIGLRNVLEEMRYRGLLREAEGGRYRTRFAESVRLLARLRQIFKQEQWHSGPALVSDLKVHLAPRRYPRRDQPADACWADLHRIGRTSALLKQVFEAMSAGAGGPVSFSGFQRRAFSRLFRAYGGRGTSGTVVSAGTSAGKTKAFYVPAFLGIARDLAADPADFTKVIAIYPRNVLLADQLREALSEASKIAPVLVRNGVRPMTFGALLGAAPWQSSFERTNEDGKRWVEANEGGSWKKVSDGFVIPFLKSSVVPGEDLVWRDADRRADRTCLYRHGANTPDIPDGVLRLTREQMQRHPPDVLFLSLEMLNRELGTAAWWQCFGIGGAGSRKPRMLLLDEVHSYEGIPGAQAAWVLRRWRHWARDENLHAVGLSATLRSPREHLGTMCGIPAEDVEVCEPADDEFQSEGMEYSVALKGDPSSGRGLLSTSIQTAMLLARVLTPRTAVKDRGEEAYGGDAFYGRKVFGFSDNLDVLNRWLSDLSHAERALHLAQYRQPPEREPGAGAHGKALLHRMDEAGQLWTMPMALGFNLQQALTVTRCSSQDPGVESASDVVVATSSLEVGFDDPEVGATLHHKRPRAMSSFVQRKGRSGRRRGTRPWTVLVLSDYGADRWAFQHAEAYFEPHIDAISLPMMNPYVLRTQAAMMLVDWIGQQVRSGSPYRFLAKPSDADEPRRRTAAGLLRSFLVLGSEWNRFETELSKVFRPPVPTRGVGSRSLVEKVAWDHPRPLLLQAVPSLLRELETNWTDAFPSQAPAQRDGAGRRPMPHYVPPATFSDLDAAEARITFGDDPRPDERMGVAHALSELCPGRVSKRYATRPRDRGLWLAGSEMLLTAGPGGTLAVKDIYPDALFLDEIDGVTVFQPVTARIAPRPQNVSDTSNAFWSWSGRFRAEGRGHILPVLGEALWRRSVTGCSAFMHREASAIEVLRFATRFDYQIRSGQEDIAGRVSLEARREGEGQRPQAVGFRIRADGIRLDLDAGALAEAPAPDAEAMRRFRQPFFQDQVRAALDGTVNVFLADWLAQVSVAALAATAAVRRCSLEEAQRLLAGHRAESARKVLHAMFGARDFEGADDPKLVQRVTELCSRPEINSTLTRLETILWGAPGDAFYAWLRRRHVATVAQAFRTAAVSGVPDVAEDDLSLDITMDDSGGASIYLTEQSIGGIGQIEQVAGFMLRTPERLEEAFSAALANCRRDASNIQLLTVARDSVRTEQGGITEVLSSIRSARSFGETSAAREALTDALASRHLDASRGAVVALLTRLASPGSSRRTDAAVTLLNRAWDRLGRRLGLELDPRVFSYVCVHVRSACSRLQDLFAASGPPGARPSESQVNALVQRLLWGRCEDACRECLDVPGRFVDYGRPSRSLTARWLGVEVPQVDADTDPGEWIARAREHLLGSGRVRIATGVATAGQAASSIMSLLLEELEVDGLFMPINVVRVEREAEAWAVTLRLPGGNHA